MSAHGRFSRRRSAQLNDKYSLWVAYQRAQLKKETLLWGKPPVRVDKTPRHESGTGREQSRNTPLGG